MPVSINNTTLTFNDATTQTTSGVTSVTAGTGISVAGGKTPTVTNTGVTSLTAAGTVTVSASTGGITITGTGGSGTVTSVATGNGLQGGTITSTGTLSVACPGYNTVGSYAFANDVVGQVAALVTTVGTNIAASQFRVGNTDHGVVNGTQNTASGTWKYLGAGPGIGCFSYACFLLCRVA
jgi:hypothetical protein